MLQTCHVLSYWRECINVNRMSVVPARIQTVEDIYRLVWTAVASKRPMEARPTGAALRWRS